MDYIYNSNNQLNLSQLIDGYELPQKYKARSSVVFKDVYAYISTHFVNSNMIKTRFAKYINQLTYIILTESSLPTEWNSSAPFDYIPDVDEDELRDTLGKYYLTPESICWDVSSNKIFYDETVAEIAAANRRIDEYNQNHKTKYVSGSVNRPLTNIKLIPQGSELKIQTTNSIINTSKMTLMQDITLDPSYPYVPRIDINNPWLVASDEDGNQFTIFTSLPIIPKKQSDISITTDCSKLIPSELMSLFPDHIMQLRHEEMYSFHEGYPDLEYDEDLGVIFPVPGFTKDQVIDNIIKYPDIINIGPGRKGKRSNPVGDNSLMKFENSAWAPFDSFIEINGELLRITQQLWEELPELNCLPPNRAFQQEYVTRKYLLERDNGIVHKYEMFGTVEPFITLFMPASDYVRRGYKNIDSIVMQCVKSRVSYYRSRSPILNRLGLKYNYEGELIVR